MYILQYRNLNIYLIYIKVEMRKISIKTVNEIKVSNIKGYFEKVVTKFGTGAKVDIPKEFLGREVVILVKNSG